MLEPLYHSVYVVLPLCPTTRVMTMSRVVDKTLRSAKITQLGFAGLLSSHS